MDSLEYIDGYFSGEFPPEETRQFEKRIEEDPVFAREVAYYLSVYVVSREEQEAEKKKRFRELYGQTGSQDAGIVAPIRARTKWRRLIPAIAAAALLTGIILCWHLFYRPDAAPTLADRYIRQNLKSLSVKMGTADGMQSGLRLYNKGKFKDALQQFEGILLSDSSNPAAMLDAGIAALQIPDYEKALGFFRMVQTRTDPRLSPALFYEAVTLMKRNYPGDATLAKRILEKIVQNDLNKKEDAMEFLHTKNHL